MSWRIALALTARLMTDDTEALEHPVDRAVRVLGTTLTDLATKLGVSKGAVGQWKESGRVVPAEHCPVIERLTGGRVRCEELNPKVDWGFLREEVA